MLRGRAEAFRFVELVVDAVEARADDPPVLPPHRIVVEELLAGRSNRIAAAAGWLNASCRDRRQRGLTFDSVAVQLEGGQSGTAGTAGAVEGSFAFLESVLSAARLAFLPVAVDAFDVVMVGAAANRGGFGSLVGCERAAEG